MCKLLAPGSKPILYDGLYTREGGPLLLRGEYVQF